MGFGRLLIPIADEIEQVLLVGPIQLDVVGLEATVAGAGDPAGLDGTDVDADDFGRRSRCIIFRFRCRDRGRRHQILFGAIVGVVTALWKLSANAHEQC